MSRLSRYVVAALLALGCALPAGRSTALAGRVFAGRTSIGPIVQPAVPGEILGFDIDQHGNDGLFANYRDLKNGKTVVSVETFDERTGKITKVVTKGETQNGGYAVYGILAGDIGFVNDGGAYQLMVPVGKGLLNGSWTPPMPFFVSQIAENQTSRKSVFLGYDNSNPSLPTALVVADVSTGVASTIQLDQSVFGAGNLPSIAQDVKTDQALITGGNSGQLTHATIGIIDLASGKTKTFQSLGFGSVNSIAVDQTTDTACAVTNLDEGVEFYNIKTQAGFEVFLPSQGSQLQSGSQVAIDPVHGLCIVTQPVSIGQGTQQSAVWVYDERGNQLEGISGFDFWFGAGMAINPSKRLGYILNPRPGYTTLTGFSY